MLRLEKEVRKRLSQRVHDVVKEYLSGVQPRPVSSDFPSRGLIPPSAPIYQNRTYRTSRKRSLFYLSPRVIFRCSIRNRRAGTSAARRNVVCIASCSRRRAAPSM